MATTKARRMRELLKQGIVVSPGIFDGYSARLVEKMGYQACSTTGAGLANSRMSQPDVGIMTLTENAAACAHFANTISIPVMADADTGYGNAVTVYHTVHNFEQAGVVGMNIEDQVSPKRCGHMRGKDVIDAREMAKKIEAGREGEERSRLHHQRAHRRDRRRRHRRRDQARAALYRGGRRHGLS